MVTMGIGICANINSHMMRFLGLIDLWILLETIAQLRQMMEMWFHGTNLDRNTKL